MKGPADRIPTPALALAGVALVYLGGMRGAVAPLAWIAPVPWLLWIRRAHTWRERLTLLLMLELATVAQVAKIITPPIPGAFAASFGVPAALGSWLLMLAWDALRRRTSELHAIYAWPALVALGEWVSGQWGPFGVWGSGAASVVDELALLQLASLLGAGAVGALMAWAAAVVAALLAAPGRSVSRAGALLAVALAATFTFGSWRLARPARAPTVRVAAVVSDLALSTRGPPSREVLDANLETLWARTALAADRGARVIAWNEGASVIEREDEPALLARASAFARARGVDLVLAYIVPTSHDPFRFENLAVFLADDGRLRARYHKRHPVPGETEPSENPVPRIERPYGVVSLAICYDHDYPEMSRQHAGVGADLVLLPSSDWAGIDPLHALMARLRAIEGGFSTLRPVRAATSVAFDPRGRVRGWMPAAEGEDRVLVADLPVHRRPTLYARVGDRPLLALVGLGLAWVLAASRGRRRRAWAAGERGATGSRRPTPPRS